MVDTADTLLERYGRHLYGARGLSALTVRAYLAGARRFIEWLSDRGDGDVDFDAMGRPLLGEYVMHLHQAGYARATFQARVAAIRSLYQWLEVVGLVAQSTVPPARSYPMRAPRAALSFLNQREVERLINAPQGGTPQKLRDRAMLEMLYATGCRLAELHDMDLGDVDLLISRVFNVSGKGNDERQVIFGDYAWDALDHYLRDGRKLLLQDDNPALWLNRYGGRLSRQTIGDLVRHYAGEAGLRSGVRPHTLRHSFATHMLEGGADLRVIQVMLGHSNVRQTETYTHVTKQEARAAYLKAHPMNTRIRVYTIANNRRIS